VAHALCGYWKGEKRFRNTSEKIVLAQLNGKNIRTHLKGRLEVLYAMIFYLDTYYVYVKAYNTLLYQAMG